MSNFSETTPLFFEEPDFTSAASSSTRNNNLQANTPYAEAQDQSPLPNCVSPHALVADTSLQLDSTLNYADENQPLFWGHLDSIPSATAAGQQPLFGVPSMLPDLFDDFDGADDVMQEDNDEQDVLLDVPVQVPFKASSPYSNTPALTAEPAFYNSLFPLTVSPRDAVLNHDEFSIAWQGLDMPKFYVADYPKTQDPVLFEEPETMDDDDEDDDDDVEDEYDEVLISSSDDDMDMEDDLYAPLDSAKVPGLTAFGIQPQEHEVHQPTQAESQPSSPEDNSASPSASSAFESPLSSPSPPYTHTHRRLPSTDHPFISTPSKPSTSTSAASASTAMPTPASTKKRLPLSHAGPHRCDILNPQTGKLCNKVFSRPYDLIRHQDTIHATVRKTFKCEMCGEASKTFSRMDALSRHVRVKHSKA